MKRFVVCLVIVAVVPMALAAPAIPGKPEIVADAKFWVPHEKVLQPDGTMKDVPVDLPAKWSSLYFAGDWPELQASVRKTLANVNLGSYKLDFDANLYSIVLLTDERKTDGELIRFLVGKQVTEPFTNNLRGAKFFREIYVTTEAGSGLQSFVNTTPLPNPIEGEVQSFIRALPLTAIADFLVATRMATLPNIRAANIADAAAAQPPAGTDHYMAVYELELPSNLATIAIETFAASAEDLGGTLAGKITRKQQSVAIREARTSPCLKALNDVLAQAAANAANANGVVDARLTGSQRKAIATAVRTAYADFVNPPAPPPPPDCPDDDTEAMIALEKAYVDLATTEVSEITEGTFSHDNLPLRQWGVAMLGGVVLHAVSDQRGAVEDGTLVRKELRAQELVSLNVTFNPVPFDATNSRMTPAERWKFFAGIVTTPDLGISAGVDFSIFKGFGIGVGYAHMRVEEATGEVEFGAEVGDKNATHKSTAGAWFVGVSYKFE